MKVELISNTSERRKMRRLLMVTLAILLLVGVFWTQTLDQLIGYTLITVAAALPILLWLRLGAPGVPILPAVAALYYIYFAVPIARENFGEITATSADLLRAALTVVLFLLSATVGWWLLTHMPTRRSTSKNADLFSATQMRYILAGGILMGSIFELAVLLGWIAAFGSFIGLVRSITLSVAAVACYLVGYARARRVIQGQFWVLVIIEMSLLVGLSWLSMVLVQGMEFLLAAVLGYFITSKRIPWKMILPALLLIGVLHAGKSEMREKYWYEADESLSFFQLPELFAEWVSDGTSAIANGQVEQNILDRASLLYQMLLVQELTPAYIPYLGGESYEFIGSYLVPRFLDPDKVASQAGMALLNLRYRLQTQQEIGTTAIGWGIITEGYANFGYAGVAITGLLFGALCAVFMVWSAGASPLSLPTLLAVAALVTMIDLEADFSYLLANLWQALAGTLIFFVPFKFLFGRHTTRQDVDVQVLGTSGAE